jgi:hypothetical protein
MGCRDPNQTRHSALAPGYLNGDVALQTELRTRLKTELTWLKKAEIEPRQHIDDSRALLTDSTADQHRAERKDGGLAERPIDQTRAG